MKKKKNSDLVDFLGLTGAIETADDVHNFAMSICEIIIPHSENLGPFVKEFFPVIPAEGIFRWAVARDLVSWSLEDWDTIKHVRRSFELFSGFYVIARSVGEAEMLRAALAKGAETAAEIVAVPVDQTIFEKHPTIYETDDLGPVTLEPVTPEPVAEIVAQSDSETLSVLHADEVPALVAGVSSLTADVSDDADHASSSEPSAFLDDGKPV